MIKLSLANLTSVALEEIDLAVQTSIGCFSRSAFESFLSNNDGIKIEAPLRNASNKAGIYFILLKKERDFLNGKPFYIGTTKNLNKRMQNLFPDHNGKYHHTLSVRMCEDVYKRKKKPSEGFQPVFKSKADYTRFLTDYCDFWFLITGDSTTWQAPTIGVFLENILTQRLKPCMAWNDTKKNETRQVMRMFKDNVQKLFYVNDG